MTAEKKEITPPEAKSHWTLNAGMSEGVTTEPVTRLQFVEKLYAAAGSPAVEGATPDFKDITGSTAMDWAAINGVIAGDGKGNVMPDQIVTREQAAVILLNAAEALGKGPEGAWATRISYTDAASISPWASEGVMWNVISGIIPAENNVFAPDGTVTAAEAEAMFAALLAK